MPRKKLVFDSMVDVVAPSGKLRKAHQAPRVSARVMIAPPCKIPATVHRSSEVINQCHSREA
jgi:hypothetical protein